MKNFSNNIINDNQKEDSEMAVFTKPINLSFELDPKKAKEFFKKSDKQAINNAIDRASKHETKYKK